MSTAAVSTFVEFQNDLLVTGVPALFYKLFANEWSGTLTLGASPGQRVIYFADGRPVFAESEQTDESLETALIRANLIDIIEADALLEAMPRGTTLREYVVATGAISEDQLHDVLAVNTREVCLGAFGLESGPYRFDQGSEWIGALDIFPQNPIELIATGLRQHFDQPTLARRLGDRGGRYLVRTEKFDRSLIHLATSQREEAWLESIDGLTVLAQLATDHADDFVGFAAFVAVLWAADMVDFLDTPRATAERSPDRIPLDELETAVKAPASQPNPAQPDPAPDPELRALETRVSELYRKLRRGARYTELLNVAPEASVRTIRAAHERILTQLSGDVALRLEPKLQTRVLRILDALQNACNALLDPRAGRRPATAPRVSVPK